MMTKTMFEMGGIKGVKTNHSLQATAATRLYKEGVDEQLIMERIGHHSIDGVRSYKRTSQLNK
uniref:Tyr recombinase domain-containing protein n=1 Tax=Amphimedon queenslandica TaxID=400682 RepID=A0A1X7VRV2_AMPQE